MHWRKKQTGDVYYQKAKEDGYRSRAIYKLIEIDDKYKLVKSNSTILDVGAAPGGWSQLVSKRLKSGNCVAVDIQPMINIANIHFICGDIFDANVLEEAIEINQKQKFTLVISDIAPTVTGIKEADVLRSIGMAEELCEICNELLAINGSFLTKVFQGAGFDGFLKLMRRSFKTVRIIKPSASRPESREVYVLGQLKR